MDTTHTPKALLYTRVSTLQQEREGMSLEGQERTLRQAAELAGYTCQLFSEGGKSGKSLTNREALSEALELLNTKQAEALYVTKLDRLARSVSDFQTILKLSDKYGWRLVALDGSIDTGSPAGKLMTNLLASMAEFESALISNRHKETHATRRANGVRWGMDKGNLPETAPGIRKVILDLHYAGVGFNSIARKLNAENVPTTRGGSKWYASTVRGIVLAPSAVRYLNGLLLNELEYEAATGTGMYRAQD